MANEYIVGQPIELMDVITDPRNADAPTDDPTDEVVVYQPDGSTVTVPSTHNGTGDYSAVFSPTLAGWHRYVWSSTTAGAGKGPGRFFVHTP